MADRGVTPAQAAREILRRRRARESLVAYSRAITIPGAPVEPDTEADYFRPIETGIAKHHIVTMEAVERCIRAPDGRLMIFEPPGSAKSTYVSVVGTTWAMGAFPGLRVLATSYAAAPIVRASKRARQIVQSAAYRYLWPDAVTLLGNSAAADEWELSNGSGLLACGLLGGITSARADLAIIDDPVAGREEADSPTIRNKTKAAYEDDFLTRIKPGASIILIQTRWHEDDLAGSILPEDYDGRSGKIRCRDGQEWEVLSIPAKCERADDPLGRRLGEYLWPEWFSARHWANFEAKPRTWSALFQQRPAPGDGTTFRRTDFHRFKLQRGQQPANLRLFLASDFATSKDGGDFTEHGKIGIDESGDIWFVGWFSGQVETDVGIDAALDMCTPLAERPEQWLGEAGPIEKAIGPAVRRRMRERSIYAQRKLLPSIVSKELRAAGIAAMVQAGRVHVPDDVPWGDELIAQLCAFPAGRYDDKVDVCGLFGRFLDEMYEAQPATLPEAPPPKPFTDAWFDARDKADRRSGAERARYYR
jgi:predicted phage terminase large subunit-like protein